MKKPRQNLNHLDTDTYVEHLAWFPPEDQGLTSVPDIVIFQGRGIQCPFKSTRLRRELEKEADVTVGHFFTSPPFNAWQCALANTVPSSSCRGGGRRPRDNKRWNQWGQTVPLLWDKWEKQLGPVTRSWQMLPKQKTRPCLSCVGGRSAGAVRDSMCVRNQTSEKPRRKQKCKARAPVIGESPAPCKDSTCWAEQRLLGEAWKSNYSNYLLWFFEIPAAFRERGLWAVTDGPSWVSLRQFEALDVCSQLFCATALQQWCQQKVTRGQRTQPRHIPGGERRLLT